MHQAAIKGLGKEDNTERAEGEKKPTIPNSTNPKIQPT
jgi:hypothetical protein